MAKHTQPNEQTAATERDEASAAHEAPQRADEREEKAAEEARNEVDESVREHYREMTDKGAKVKGEGEIA